MQGAKASHSTTEKQGFPGENCPLRAPRLLTSHDTWRVKQDPSGECCCEKILPDSPESLIGDFSEKEKSSLCNFKADWTKSCHAELILGMVIRCKVRQLKRGNHCQACFDPNHRIRYPVVSI